MLNMGEISPVSAERVLGHEDKLYIKHSTVAVLHNTAVNMETRRRVSSGLIALLAVRIGSVRVRKRRLLQAKPPYSEHLS